MRGVWRPGRRAIRGLSTEVRGRGGERGSATVLGLGAILLMLAVLIGFLVVGAAVRGSLQARAAADAAALAGAGVLLEGGGEANACAAAGDLAAANGAELLRCDRAVTATETVRARLQVEVALTVTGLPGVRAHAVAHAGAVPGSDHP